MTVHGPPGQFVDGPNARMVRLLPDQSQQRGASSDAIVDLVVPVGGVQDAVWLLPRVRGHDAHQLSTLRDIGPVRWCVEYRVGR